MQSALYQEPAAPKPALGPSLKRFFAQLSQLRYRPLVLYPNLCWRYLRNYRRDRVALMGEFHEIMRSCGVSLDPKTLGAYVADVILLHYVQQSKIAVYTMLTPELMESLAREAARVIREEIPGDFVDVGVWKGGSSMIMRTVATKEGQPRPLHCLDIFDTMDERVLDEADPFQDHAIIAALNLAREYFKTEGVRTSVEEVRQNFQRLGVSLDDVNFVVGNLTSRSFPFERVGTIALLRIDCDFYSATKQTMEQLYPRISSGGCIILDDYFLEAFGERRAVDEYREAHGIVAPVLRVGQSALWIKP